MPGRERAARRPVGVQARAHDFVRIQVPDRAPVAPAAAQAHVRAIADPNLFRPARRQAPDEAGAAQQRQPRSGGNHAPFAAADEPAVAGQQGQEVVPARAARPTRQQQEMYVNLETTVSRPVLAGFGWKFDKKAHLWAYFNLNPFCSFP